MSIPRKPKTSTSTLKHQTALARSKGTECAQLKSENEESERTPRATTKDGMKAHLRHLLLTLRLLVDELLVDVRDDTAASDGRLNKAV